MILTIPDRLYFIALMDLVQANYKTYQIKNKLIKKIELSSEEITECELQQNPQTRELTWNNTVAERMDLDIELDKEEKDFVLEICESLKQNETMKAPDDVWEFLDKLTAYIKF